MATTNTNYQAVGGDIRLPDKVPGVATMKARCTLRRESERLGTAVGTSTRRRRTSRHNRLICQNPAALRPRSTPRTYSAIPEGNGDPAPSCNVGADCRPAPE